MPESSPGTDPSLRLYVFRVEEGIGNACLLKFPDGTFGIVDWGTEAEGPIKLVLSLVRETRLRFIAATHAHEDHTLGIPKLIELCGEEKIEIEHFFYPASTLHKPEAALTDARKLALKFKISTHALGINQLRNPTGRPYPVYLAWAEDPSLAWELRLLAPALDDVARSEIKALGKSIVPGNETSMVLLFRFHRQGELGQGRALLTGDATPGTLNFANSIAENFPELSLDNQAFVVPHHGSSANLPKQFENLLHGVVVISAPSQSSYHPSSKILERLAARTCSSNPPRLFCTSYAQACRTKFGGNADPNDRHLVQPGPCFGVVVVRIPCGSNAEVESTSDQTGARRRVFGYCGRNLPAAMNSGEGS
jgi:glyoxylase-like metal-dependent hydrolase (beta-lactamase superfamily II)